MCGPSANTAAGGGGGGLLRLENTLVLLVPLSFILSWDLLQRALRLGLLQ